MIDVVEMLVYMMMLLWCCIALHWSYGVGGDWDSDIVMMWYRPRWFCRTSLVTSALCWQSLPGIGMVWCSGLWDMIVTEVWYWYDCDGGGVVGDSCTWSYCYYCCCVTLLNLMVDPCIREQLWWTNIWGADWQVLLRLDGSWIGWEAWIGGLRFSSPFSSLSLFLFQLSDYFELVGYANNL